MKALDELIRDVPPGRTIVVRAQALGLSDEFLGFLQPRGRGHGLTYLREALNS